MTAVEKSKIVTSVIALVEAQASDRIEMIDILAAAYLSVITPRMSPIQNS